MLYDFVLALAPARYLIDGSRSPTENTQASKQATNPCHSMILRLAVLVELRFVTDRRTDRQTDRRTDRQRAMASTADA